MNEVPASLGWGLLPLVAFLVWLSVVVYVLVLATRLVRGVERIARSLERDPRPGPPL